jgi:hypothetical protein
VPALQLGHPELFARGTGSGDLNPSCTFEDRDAKPARKQGISPGIHNLSQTPCINAIHGDRIQGRMVRSMVFEDMV